MPQREFWTEAHPVEIRLSLQLNLTDPDANPTCAFGILDQSGKQMAWTGGFLPVGFAAWAFADACRAGLEAWEAGTPEQAVHAFTRARTEWLRSADQISRLH